MFKCKHPIDKLYVKKEQTVEKVDKDFEHVTYYFRCVKCNKEINIKHARLIYGVTAFLGGVPNEST